MKTSAWGKMRGLLVACFVGIFASAAVFPAAGQSEGQALHVFVGKSVVINMQTPISRILSSNPSVIDTLATSPTQVVVEGKSPGTSSLILWDSNGHSQILDVTVDVNISHLKTAIEQTYPGQHINIQSDGAHLILTGTVSDAKVSDDVVKMASSYSTGVVNSLTVAPVHEQQILLEVKFAEVDRTKLQNFGINILSTGAANTIGTVSTGQFNPPTIPTQLTGIIGAGNTGTSTSFQLNSLLNIFLFRPDLNLGATISDLQNKNVLEILASPNLLALNGQKADFLAGGEFPFPVLQGGQNVGAVTIQFRPFGVKLDFTATVGPDRVIRMHIAPEVSTLDFTQAVTVSGVTVPAISTRRAETEIELRDGQSFGIAGLLDNRATVQLSKVPGIGDIPVLGNLFRSRSINRSNSELMVMVTPRIVDPVQTNAAAAPLPTPPVKFLETPQFDKGLPASGTENKTGSQQPGVK
ncbi:MAG TPA: pilus assembly protein N-terminal domain-containing protein [Terriglobales bacterium]|nr:pilus assembly protein N-terminal domain-containing protein [Terriglobales bacterium]